MELRHLRYFVTAAEELNISRASARLRISQPAVSRQIKDLEAELGVELFHREKSGLRLTAPGENFLAHARDLLRRSNEAIKHMASMRQRPPAKLTVGYITPVLASTLSPALREFSRKNPDVELELREMTPGAQARALRDGKIDLALLGNPAPDAKAEFKLMILVSIPLQAVLPDNHLLALRKRIRLPELKDDPFIGFAEERFPGRNAAICSACQAAGFTPRFRHRVGDLSGLLALVAAGKGVTLAPAEVSQLAHPQAVFVPLKSPVPFIVSAAARRKDDANLLVQDLVECCQMAAAKKLRVTPEHGGYGGRAAQAAASREFRKKASAHRRDGGVPQ